MAPAQPFTEIDQDCRPSINAKVELDRENRSSLPNSAVEGLGCMKNCEDTAIRMNGEDKASMCTLDVDVDIVECRNNHNSSLQAETEDPDATEYSSSFADTTSDTENFSGFSEGEVQSQFFADNGLASAFDAFSSSFQMRKKKLTNHWRNFIRPIMWRCKWMELRIKEIESQALKYSRELAVADQRKHSGFDQFTLEEFGSKSVPFSSQCRRKKAMKRRKRKRVEETTDIASYMSHHNVFSYLENKRSDPDGTSVADEFSNAVIITEQSADYNDKLSTGDDWSFFESRDGDKSLEHVLWKIETVHSRVHKMKNQIDVVMSKNACRFSSSENLSLLVPCDAPTSSAHSPAFSAGNGDTISAGAIYTSTQHISEYNLGDMVMPESAVSSFGEAVVPDIIESTVGLLSAIDVTFHQPQFGDSSEDIVDNVLIPNEAAEGEKHTFELISDQPKETHEQPDKGIQEEDPFPTPSSEPDPLVDASIPQEQSTLESCLASDVNFPRNKRKRGERRAGSVVWSKKCSGEPDSL
ncbi:hypothetical protein ACE6H2_002160 [Prunus campanulata]